MDGQRFDALSRLLAAPTTRRSALKIALGLLAGGGALAGRGVASADSCEEGGDRCTLDSQCCTGVCNTDPALPLAVRNRCACEAGRTACRDDCAILDLDREHCGACNVRCARGKVCCMGACVTAGTCTTCPAGMTMCAGKCVPLAEDEKNCGTCGACGVACAADEICCSGHCAVLGTEFACSRCGDECETDEVCTAGVCGFPPGSTCTEIPALCDSDEACCGGVCIDVEHDESNCGACGSVCGAGETCCDGRCKNLQTDTRNCGRCERRCRRGQVCTAGICR